MMGEQHAKGGAPSWDRLWPLRVALSCWLWEVPEGCSQPTPLLHWSSSQEPSPVCSRLQKS